MRKERDRAVSELAESLRESDAIKKQRNELLKENKVGIVDIVKQY